jgi:hypothetical protein
VGTTARFEGRAHLVLTASAALTTGRSAATTALRLQRIQRPFGRVERV